MSASWMTTISPSTCGMAALIAAPFPLFRCRSTRASCRPSRQLSTIAEVASVEPSSTTITCFSNGSRSIRWSTSPIVASSL
jgi:hypothetical protein